MLRFLLLCQTIFGLPDHARTLFPVLAGLRPAESPTSKRTTIARHRIRHLALGERSGVERVHILAHLFLNGVSAVIGGMVGFGVIWSFWAFGLTSLLSCLLGGLLLSGRGRNGASVEARTDMDDRQAMLD